MRRLIAAATCALSIWFLPPSAPAPLDAGSTAQPAAVAGLIGSPTPVGYSPTQIRHAYGFDRLTQDGSNRIIAIVNAFDNPNVGGDLETFIGTFNLRNLNGLPSQPGCTVALGPHPCFQKVFAQGVLPAANHPAWELESDTDVEWAHAIAPGADILLVEASGGTLDMLLQGVDVGVGDGAVAVSMSWVFPETSTEIGYDSHFNRPGVAFFAASGNSGTGVHYPAASPYVLGVGGTRISLDGSGNPTSAESAWYKSSGGISLYEPEPGYQSAYPIPSTGGFRGAPDVAYDAAPATGVAVYDSIPRCFGCATGWFQIGGTSIGTPQWAALIALVDQQRSAGPLSGNDLLYAAAGNSLYSTDYRDIVSGTNGTCGSICTAGPGYDFLTGLGSPRAAALVPYLIDH